MSELKVHRFITTDELFPVANAGGLYYKKAEADKVIAELKARIEELEEERRWRKFSEEKPDDKQVVLVSDGEWFETAIYHDDGSIDFGDDIHFSNITEAPYWLPLPSAPKEEK